LIFFVMVGASRAWARFWLVDVGHTSVMQSGRLLVYGAGTAGAQTAAALRMSHQYALLGFVDDDPAKVVAASMVSQCMRQPTWNWSLPAKASPTFCWPCPA
jgi:FlaA1/EpsC-like NDP-sugar epimerase